MAGAISLSYEGFRFDGRRPKELRQIGCKIGVYKQADGSAYIEQGNTKVLATVFGPHEVCWHVRLFFFSFLLSFVFTFIIR